VTFIGLGGGEEGALEAVGELRRRPALKLGGAHGGGLRKWRRGGGVSAC
jgi:hypothetical protein